MIAEERLLYNAPRAPSVDPVRVRAAALAIRHARQHVSLRPFDLVWCYKPGAVHGQTIVFPDGRIEVRLRADLPERSHPMLTAREQVWVALHEMGHVHDAQVLHRMTEEQAEKQANDFAGWAIKSFPWEEMR